MWRVWERREVCTGCWWKSEGKRPLGRPRRRWEYNIKMDLQEVGGVVGTEWSWLRIGQLAGTCEYGKKPLGSIKLRWISWLAAKWLSSQEGLCSMEWVSKLLTVINTVSSFRPKWQTSNEYTTVYLYITLIRSEIRKNKGQILLLPNNFGFL
jgi:hypothetical protein